MAGTAVQVFRDNGLPATKVTLNDPALAMIQNKKDADGKIANAQKFVDGIKKALQCPDSRGFTRMNNLTSSDLNLEASRSLLDGTLKCIPHCIPSHGSIAMERDKTIGAAVVYRSLTRCGEAYDWVLAWADEPDCRASVFTAIHDPRVYDEEEWANIFAKLKMSGPTSFAAYLGYTACAVIVNVPNGPSVVDASICGP